jgi:hypothetical protein
MVRKWGFGVHFPQPQARVSSEGWGKKRERDRKGREREDWPLSFLRREGRDPSPQATGGGGEAGGGETKAVAALEVVRDGGVRGRRRRRRRRRRRGAEVGGGCIPGCILWR